MNKYLGQHFLINKNKIKKIIEALELKTSDIIIEIGPGHGELTEEFKTQNLGFKIIAVEKDKKLSENLKEKFAEYAWIEIIEADILKILPEIVESYKLKTKSYKIVGNIPYYITGYLLRILGELKYKPLLVVLTIQKEVAERICSAPPKMNLLAANVQFWTEPKIIDYISKKDFHPAPKIDSAIIKLKIKSAKLKVNPENYRKFIKSLFKQPRKTILNNLLEAKKQKPIQESEIERREFLRKKLLKAGVNFNGRPQNLSIGKIKELCAICTSSETYETFR